MTWLSIVDSAVKIGLGALIAGVFAFLVARLNHARDDEKEYLAKRRALLEKAIDGLNLYHKGYASVRALYLTHVRRRESGQVESPEEIQKFLEVMSNFAETTAVIIEVEGCILAAGEPRLHERVTDYHDHAVEVYRSFYLGNTKIGAGEVKMINDEMRLRRKTILLEIAKAYKMN